MEKKKQSLIAFFSTYPPRKCGLATFTQDLSLAIDKLANPGVKSKIIAINDNGNSYDYTNDVMYQINDIRIQDYLDAANKINNNDRIKLVSVQHEFKLYSTEHGENLLVFLNAIKKPVVTTFHTVLPGPSELRKMIIRSIAKHSEYLIVMSQLAIEILEEDYNIDRLKIVVIPHGVHDVPYEQNTHLKKNLGYEDRILLTSFGYLRPGRGVRSSGRGYEFVIEALPDIIKQFPNVLYLIIGITHPKTLKEEGERYRNILKSIVEEKGIENNVKFINKYVSLDELFDYLKATNVYICSQLNPHQITSGTLTYAMGCGCAVVSTPFLHAKEVVTPGRGILLDDFGDSDLISKAVIKLLSNPDSIEKMKRNAYSFTRNITWLNIAQAYKKVFEKCVKLSEKD